MRPGHEVVVSLPRNNFKVIESQSYLFIAGGIGITPILPMIAEVDRRGASWELHYGAKSHASVAFLRELECYGDRVHLVLDRPLDLDSLLGVPKPGTVVYTCGPSGLLNVVESYAERWPAGALRVERFCGDSHSLARESNRPIHVKCIESGIELKVGADVTILDALENAGLEVPSSCREGICGTCETRVIAGSPDHRDSVLTPDEKERGGTMMVCVSRAKTAELSLDI